MVAGGVASLQPVTARHPMDLPLEVKEFAMCVYICFVLCCIVCFCILSSSTYPSTPPPLSPTHIPTNKEEAMTTSTHAAATDKAEKKKSKKKKREASENGHHEEEEKAPAPAEEEEEEEEEEEAAAAAAAAEKKARKKAKKEAKRLAKLDGAAATNGDAPAAEKEEEEEEEEELSKKEKKRSKKEKKRQEKEAGNGSSSTVPSTPSSSSASSSSGIMSQTEAQAWWEKNEILVSGPGCELFLPTLTFAGANFPTDLLACTKGFTTPTPIQAQCWPVLMAGRDIIGIAETGSGKTLTFALPGLVHIRAKVKEGGGGGKGGRQQHVPRMLVVAPTRELAMQSAEVLEGVLSGLDLRSTCLFGGVNKHEQRQALRQGVDIVVATPGRLADLMEEGECDLSQVSYLVLDEADRMLDQGFEQAIRGIILECAPAEKRQTALFSATWPQSIQTLAREFLRDPVKVTIGGEDLSSNKRVKQVVEVLGEFDREKRLRVLLQQYHGKRDNRVLVFALYKKVRACSWGWVCVCMCW